MRNLLDRRELMIAQTSAFLTWALAAEVALPRIPRHRVADGGFSRWLDLPGARTAANYWWRRTFDIMDRLSEPGLPRWGVASVSDMKRAAACRRDLSHRV